MTKQNEKTIQYRCVKCGTPLTDENSRERKSMCIDCECETFEGIEEKNGAHIAIFIMCAATDTIFSPRLIPPRIAEDPQNHWLAYIKILSENELYDKGFSDGESDIRQVFGKNLSETDVGKYLHYETARVSSLPGTKEQRAKWGEADQYTAKDYDALDQMYNNRVQSYKGQTITDQIDYVLTEVCKWQLMASKLRVSGKIKAATDALKVVDNLLASECLRKKDEKPLEEARVDAFIIALENAGLMEKGHFLNFEETVKVLQDNFIKTKKYDYSLDACDQVVLDIVNAMRGNSDMEPLMDLPEDLMIEDEYGEFEQKETEAEEKNKHYIGLTKIRKSEGT